MVQQIFLSSFFLLFLDYFTSRDDEPTTVSLLEDTNEGDALYYIAHLPYLRMTDGAN